MRYCMVLQGERVVVTRFFDALAAALRSQVVPQAFSPEMLDWAPRKVRWWRFWAAQASNLTPGAYGRTTLAAETRRLGSPVACCWRVLLRKEYSKTCQFFSTAAGVGLTPDLWCRMRSRLSSLCVVVYIDISLHWVSSRRLSRRHWRRRHPRASRAASGA